MDRAGGGPGKLAIRRIYGVSSRSARLPSEMGRKRSSMRRPKADIGLLAEKRTTPRGLRWKADAGHNRLGECQPSAANEGFDPLGRVSSTCFHQRPHPLEFFRRHRIVDDHPQVRPTVDREGGIFEGDLA